jgi:hypothetical protein
MRQQVPTRSFKHAFRGALAGLAVLAVLALGACGGSSSETDTHARLSDLCQQTTSRDSDYCGCVADHVIGMGYDTEAEIDQLEALVSSIDDSGTVTQLPQPVIESLNACEQPAAAT